MFVEEPEPEPEPWSRSMHCSKLVIWVKSSPRVMGSTLAAIADTSGLKLMSRPASIYEAISSSLSFFPAEAISFARAFIRTRPPLRSLSGP